MSLGPASRAKLAECDAKLQALVEDVAAAIDAGALASAGIRDLTVVCGYRGQVEQDAAYAAGTSKLRWPNSRHNRRPSAAVDLAPYPIDWQNRDAFLVLRGFVLARAAALGTPLRVISWDLPHFELA